MYSRSTMAVNKTRFARRFVVSKRAAQVKRTFSVSMRAYLFKSIIRSFSRHLWVIKTQLFTEIKLWFRLEFDSRSIVFSSHKTSSEMSSCWRVDCIYLSFGWIKINSFPCQFVAWRAKHRSKRTSAKHKHPSIIDSFRAFSNEISNSICSSFDQLHRTHAYRGRMTFFSSCVAIVTCFRTINNNQ